MQKEPSDSPTPLQLKGTFCWHFTCIFETQSLMSEIQFSELDSASASIHTSGREAIHFGH